MTPAPSIDAVSGLLRERSDASFRPDGKPHHFQYTARDAELDRRAADALEAQGRELAEARAEIERLRGLVSSSEAQRYRDSGDLVTRIAALEDAVRVKDEALRPFAGAARETDDGTRDDRNLRSHSAANLITAADLRRARTALSNGEPHA